MRRHSVPRGLAALAITVLLATFARSPALAAPDRIVRQPDMSLSPCLAAAPTAPGEPVPSRPQGVACTIHAVGDFNGDGADDLLVSSSSGGDVSLGAQFMVAVGPFDAKAEPRAGIPLPTASNGLEPVHAALVDANGDGVLDVALSQAKPVGDDFLQTVSVVLGGRQWMLPDAPEEAVPFDLRFSRRAPIGARSMESRASSAVTVAFADLNADGYQDAILGADKTIHSFDGVAGMVSTTPMDASEIAVMFGQGDWSHETRFRDDLVLRGLGRCGGDKPGLAGVAEVTGDGLPDILARRCPGGGLPDRPSLVDGATLAAARSEPERSITIGAADPSGPTAPPALWPVPGIPGFPGLLAGVPEFPSRLAGLGGSLADGDLPPPDPGRGYLPAGDAFRPEPFFSADLSGDGVKDVLFGLGEHAHVWLGGADLGERLDALQSDRVFAHAGFGMSARSGAWRPADMDRDGSVDLLLTGREDLTCPDNARCRPRESRPDRAEITDLRFFRSGWAMLPVIDVDLDPPAAIWNTGEQTVWAVGDFDGDGDADILLGDTRGAGSEYGLAFGPF